MSLSVIFRHHLFFLNGGASGVLAAEFGVCPWDCLVRFLFGELSGVLIEDLFVLNVAEQALPEPLEDTAITEFTT